MMRAVTKAKRREPSVLLRVLGLLTLASPIVLTRLVGACHDGAECFDGEYLECQCDDESWGYAKCDEKSEIFGACVCDGTTPGLVTAASSGASGAGGGDGTGGADGELPPSSWCEPASVSGACAP